MTEKECLYVNLNPVQLSSLSAFANASGRIQSGRKDVWFLRYIGYDDEKKYAEQIRELDRFLLNKQREGLCGYVRINHLEARIDPAGAQRYMAVCEAARLSETAGAAGPSAAAGSAGASGLSGAAGAAASIQNAGGSMAAANGLSFQFADALRENTLWEALRRVMQLYRTSSSNISDSMVKNFGVKLLYWADLWLPKLFQPSAAGAERASKFVLSGGIKVQEYLFLYFLVSLGCDVLWINPEGDIALGAGLLELSQCFREKNVGSVPVPPLQQETERNVSSCGSQPEGGQPEGSVRLDTSRLARPDRAGSSAGRQSGPAGTAGITGITGDGGTQSSVPGSVPSGAPGGGQTAGPGASQGTAPQNGSESGRVTITLPPRGGSRPGKNNSQGQGSVQGQNTGASVGNVRSPGTGSVPARPVRGGQGAAGAAGQGSAGAAGAGPSNPRPIRDGQLGGSTASAGISAAMIGAATGARGTRSPAGSGAARRELEYEELAKLSPGIVMISAYDKKGECFKTGSGVVVSEKGYILTNFHVAVEASYYGIRFEEQEQLYQTNELIKYNQFHDLAIIKIDRHCTPIPVYAGGRELVRGQKVVAIGSPLGLFNSVSDGIISGFRVIGDVSMIQFTAPISHGSSGGALLNMYGELIGIITAGFDDGQNINLAVEYKTVRAFAGGFL